jgi:hypothetical protein
LRRLIIFIFAGLFVNWLKLAKPVNFEVVVSHPRIYPSVPVVGRPGIRLPNPHFDFALHYQIHDDKIVTTVMPSMNWAISNLDLVAALQESLAEIQNIVSQAQGNDDNDNV